MLMHYIINQYEIVCLIECLRMILGTFMRVAVDHSTCKELQEMYLKEHAPQMYPLPSSTSVILMCDRIATHIKPVGMVTMQS